MPQISKLVRSVVYSRISDSALGYNAAIESAAANYDGVDTGLLIIPDWTPGSGTFIFGRVPPDSVEASSVMAYPLVTIDTMRTVTGTGAQRWTMASTFAGIVEAVIDVHISFADSEALPDFASYGDLVEDAMFASLNNPASVMSASGLAYSGRLSLTRGPIVMGGQNWRQTLTFAAPFAANI